MYDTVFITHLEWIFERPICTNTLEDIRLSRPQWTLAEALAFYVNAPLKDVQEVLATLN